MAELDFEVFKGMLYGPKDTIVSILDTPVACIMAYHCCHNKLPQSQWLKLRSLDPGLSFCLLPVGTLEPLLLLGL